MLNFEGFGLICLVVYIIFIVKKKKENLADPNVVLNCFLFVYILILMNVTIFPLPIDTQLIRYSIDHPEYNPTNNFIPFQSISNYLSGPHFTVAVKNILGNILLLAPLGFFLNYYKRGPISLMLLILIGFFSSLSVELSQLLISSILGFTYRSFDVDDLILNTIGFTLGFIIFHIFQRLIPAQYLKKFFKLPA
ncbi:VanZ family protein [Mesobacillus foraminis]|uniref:VanZ family protein n=1 Tax=Mesobacillus foraminis TaxID=279826 RepID=UPI001BED349F|nr:VanZ family protein [Mesobacillus foraminis]MBT2757574.1 VanZ family protein [Mesobacillus foraminis]